jgi:DNA-binding IclR family transcriptional regulator
MRLGVNEVPGRVPMSADEKRGKQTVEVGVRGQQIMAALRKRPMRGHEIFKLLGVTPQVAHNTLSSLLNDGLIEYSKEGRTRPVWAIAKVKTSGTQGEVT